jgi:SAM-dependent methyltransferase
VVGFASNAGYAFGNDSPHAASQHHWLAAAYDPITTARLAETGVTDGWRCLEVGAGGGSVARWLAERVAPTGSVLATDVKPEQVPAAARLEVLLHDVVRDPLPDGAFDLIHARLVLRHLPERRRVLDKLVRALRPGGWLQVDEFDNEYGPVLVAPDEPSRDRYEAFLTAKERVFALAGVDGAFGRRVAAAMRDAGLVDVDPEPYLAPWRAGSAGLELLIHTTHHLRDELIAVGMTDRQLAEVRAVMRHPEFRATSCVTYSVLGRRPW